MNQRQMDAHNHLLSSQPIGSVVSNRFLVNGWHCEPRFPEALDKYSLQGHRVRVPVPCGQSRVCGNDRNKCSKDSDRHLLRRL